jgi:diguanylate cyclase (GGDEF)-like protein
MKIINTYYEDKFILKEFVEKNHNILFAEKSSVLIQIFSGICERDFLRKLSVEVKEMIPHAHIIGTTTAGEIMNGAVSGLKTALSFSVFMHTDIRCSFFKKDNQSDYQLGQSIMTELSGENAKVLILFATGLTLKVNDLLYGIQSINPTLPIAGGNAGDNSLMQQSFVFDDNDITDCGIVGVVLESNHLYVNSYWHLGWQPIGKEMTITKANNSRVYTIDNIPSCQAYETYLGLDGDSNFQNALEYPLVLNRHKITIARSPMVRHEDGSLSFAADIYEGEKVRFSYGHVGIILDQIEKLCQKISLQPAEGIFIYSCASRRGYLQNNSEIETMPLQRIAPSAGFLTYGEYFHSSEVNQLLNGTMTVLVLSESERTTNKGTLDSALIDSSNSQELSNKDNVAEKGVGTLRALTHLINIVTDELVAANKKLEYISLHDALTGLFNRAFFQQEMKRFDVYQGTVGIIICDIDCLKLVNDTLGHSFGDELICAAAACLSSVCRTEDIVARIGGDEFAILLPDADENMLSNMCSSILRSAEQKSLSSNLFLHMSLGYALKPHSEINNMKETFKLADKNMYRIKSTGATSVHKTMLDCISCF